MSRVELHIPMLTKLRSDKLGTQDPFRADRQLFFILIACSRVVLIKFESSEAVINMRLKSLLLNFLSPNYGF